MRLALLLVFAVSLPSAALAEDRVVLSEVIPALAGTDLGALELGAAPPPGTSRLVHRGEVLAALRAAHRTSLGLAIPGATRVTREARVLDARALEALARPALARALGVCTISGVRAPPRILLPVGRPETSVEIAERIDSGSVPATLVVAIGARVTRVPLQVSLSCPAPIVASGQRVRLVVRVGGVRATAPGEAREAGRLGSTIRVANLESGSVLRGRVVASDAVEVIP